MKKLSLYFCMICALLAASCRKGDEADLLATIPSNTGFFAVVDLVKVNKALGNDVNSDGSVKTGDKLNQVLAAFGKQGDELKNMLDGDKASVDFTRPLGAFEYKGSPVVTFYVSDAKAYMKYIEEQTHSEFKEIDKIWQSATGGIFVKGNQVWVSSGASTFTAETVKMLSALPEDDSLISIEYARKLVDEGKDVAGWATIAALTGYSDNPMMNLGITTLYDGAAYLPFTVTFENGKAQLSAKVLDKKFQPARCTLRPSTIQASVLNEYQGKGDVFFAISIDPAQAKDLLGQYGQFMGQFASLGEILGNTDGTIVGSANSASEEASFGLMTNFTSQETAREAAETIMDMMPPSELAVELTGTKLYIHSHNLEGETIGGSVKLMEGAEWAMVLTPDKVGAGDAVSNVVVKALRQGDSTEFLLTVNTKPGQNALLSLLEMATKK